MRLSPQLLVGACSAADRVSRYRYAEFVIWDELTRSLAVYPRRWCSLEEGAMVLGEEVDELRVEIHANNADLARAEAIQVGAMAVRFIADLHAGGGDAGARCLAASELQRRIRPVCGPRGRVLASSHEGFGFLKREFDGLWAAVCQGQETRPGAARVAAMAVRFIAEVGVGAIDAAEAGR